MSGPRKVVNGAKKASKVQAAMPRQRAQIPRLPARQVQQAQRKGKK